MCGPKKEKVRTAMSLSFVLLDFQHSGLEEEGSVRDGV